MRYELTYSDKINFTEVDNVLTISGVAWKGYSVPNKKVILASENEIVNIAKSLKGSPLQADHSKSIKDTIGIVNNSSKAGDSVLYEAEIHDSVIADKVRSGLVNQCSVGLKVDKIEHVERNGEPWFKLTGVSVVELSLVLKGAVEGNTVTPEFTFRYEPDPDPVNTDSQDFETKFTQARELIVELGTVNIMLTAENDTLKKRLYWSRLFNGEEIPESVLGFNMAMLEYFADLKQDLESSHTIAGIAGEDGSTQYTQYELAKNELTKMLKGKSRGNIRDWQRKYSLDDNK